MKKLRIIACLLIINILVSIILSLFEYNVEAVTQSIKNDISTIDEKKYPGIKEKIKKLQKEHPNWNFKILYTGIDWKEAITYEYTGHGSSPKNLVPDSSSYSGEWVCSCCGDKVYDSGSWKCASISAIKYMMDPRAFLNSSDIFQFLELSYNKESGYSKDVVKSMLSGSFLEKDEYINAIMEACKKNNVNPYYIVARIIQEQGKSGSVLTKGEGYKGQYVGYYNIFNIGASGNTSEKVILNGLAKAQKYGWTSMELSIEGGIGIIVSSYISVGQNTMYFQKFDVENSDGKLYWHQYMQNILAAENEGLTLRKTLSNINAIDYKYTFIIPVYENMPTNTSTKPVTNKASNDKEVDLIYTNVTSSIRIRNAANGGSTIGYLYSGEIVTRLEKAKTKIGGTYWDKILKSNGTVGYVARSTYDTEATYKEYLVPINNNNTGNSSGNTNTTNNTNSSGNTNTANNTNTTNNTNSSGNTNTTNSNTNNSGSTINTPYKKGDINNDGKITPSDYVLIKNHILGTKILKDKAKTAADVNGDGKITPSDYVLIKNHILYGNKL